MDKVKSGSVFSKSLFWLIVIQVIGSMAYYGYVPLIPFIDNEFVLNKSQVGWMTSAVFLGSSLIAIPSGIITDKIGARHTLFIFSLILSIVTFIFYFSTNYYMILILLFFLGTGYGGITPGTNKSIMGIFGPLNRGTAMGLKQMGVPLGSTIGTLSLPFIASVAGWRSSMLVVSVVIIIICSIHYKMLPDDRDYKQISSNKIINNIKNVLKNKKFTKVLSVITFFIWIQLSVITYLVLYLNESIHVSLTISFLCLALLQIGGVVGRAGWGVISDNFSNHNRGNILAIIGVISGLLVIILGLLNESLAVIIIVLLSFLLGITTQGWNGIFVIMVSEVVESHEVGLASGIALATVYIGAILGTPLSGWIIDQFGSYKIMWLITGGVMLLIGLITYYMKFDEDVVE